MAAGALLGTATLDDLIVEMEKLCNCDLPDLGPDTGGDGPSAFEPVGWSAKPAWSPIHPGEPRAPGEFLLEPNRSNARTES